MVSVYAWKTQENLNLTKKKVKNVNFFLEVCLMDLDQDKIINCVPERIADSCLKPFWKDNVSQ